jgi:glycerophosphoryl diester phosphodiesterase
MTRIIAHRGAATVAPENTLAAFRAATLLGADGVELDVHASSDDEPVVIHDHDVARTTNGRGEVRTLDLAALKRLDAGAKFAPAFRGERIPTLDEVLALEGPTFEIQLCGLSGPFLTRVAEAIDHRDAWGRVEITSDHVPLLVEIKRMRPRARIGFFAFRRAIWASDGHYLNVLRTHARLLDARVVHVPSPSLDASIVDGLQAEGLIVHAGDANGAALERALALGADQLTTDDVAAAVEARRALREADRHDGAPPTGGGA